MQKWQVVVKDDVRRSQAVTYWLYLKDIECKIIKN